MTRFILTIATVILLGAWAAQASAEVFGYSYESPQENVQRSAYYDHLLQVSAPFRHYRMRKECAPIDYSPALHDDCIGSFDTYEPIAPGYQ